MKYFGNFSRYFHCVTSANILPGDGAICSEFKNRKIVPHHRENVAQLQSPSPIMAPDEDIYWKEEIETFSLGGEQIKVSLTNGKIVLIWFLLGHDIQRRSACRLSFSSDCQSLDKAPLLICSQSLVCVVILLLTQNIKVGDVIYYGYLFRIVFQ